VRLIERVQQLGTAAAATDDEYTIKHRTGELVSLAELVEALTQTARRLGEGVAELRTAGVAIDSGLTEKAKQVAAALHALSGALPAQAVDAPLDGVKRQVRAAQSFVMDLRSFVEEAWAQERAREVPAINEELVSALAQAGIEVEEIRSDIETAQSVLVGLNNRSVPASGDVVKLAAALEALRACGERISRLVEPTLAGVILDAQRATGVSLASFTPEVLAGLARLGILDRFRVRLK
jgi:hypothetical protein